MLASLRCRLHDVAEEQHAHAYIRFHQPIVSTLESTYEKNVRASARRGGPSTEHVAGHGSDLLLISLHMWR